MNSIDKSAASLQSLDDHSLLTFPLHGPALIEASAGTGKTWCVTSLYLRHILAGRTVSEVLVVTYTNAATEELRGRIRQRLADALVCMDEPCQVADDFLINLLAKIDDEKERHLCRDRLRLALRSMDEAAIYTIHGFCQRMLSDFSFATGQQYDTEIIQDESTLRQQVVNDWWRQKTYGLDQADAYFFFSTTQIATAHAKADSRDESGRRRSHSAGNRNDNGTAA